MTVVVINGASIVGADVGVGVGAGGVVVVVAVVVANMALPFPGFWVLCFGDRQGRNGATALGGMIGGGGMGCCHGVEAGWWW